jgi:hypothetical protein
MIDDVILNNRHVRLVITHDVREYMKRTVDICSIDTDDVFLRS